MKRSLIDILDLSVAELNDLIATACDMLASGKRRACCFDRSGMYSRGNLGPPQAAE